MNFYKICFVKLAYYPPVMGTEFYEHSQQAAKLGHPVCVIAVKRNGEAESEMVGKVEVSRVAKPANGHLGNALFVFKALRILSQRYFDIVHVYAFGKCFMLPLLARFFPNGGKVKWLHNLLQVNTVGGLRGFLQNKKAKFSSYFFDAVIVSDNREDSEIKRRILGDHFGKPCFLVAVGTNVTRYDLISEHKVNSLKRKYNIVEQQIVLIYSGSIIPHRNLSVLVRAFKQVSDRHDNLRLFFVGAGAEMAQLRELSQELDLDNKLVFTGLVDYNTVPEYLKMADVGISYIPINDFLDCQPSLKTIEYLAAGLPVIVTNTAGNRLFVKHGYNGLLINDDENDIVEAIESLMINTELRRQFANNSHSSVSNFDWMLIVKDQLIPAYKNLLDIPG